MSGSFRGNFIPCEIHRTGIRFKPVQYLCPIYAAYEFADAKVLFRMTSTHISQAALSLEDGVGSPTSPRKTSAAAGGVPNCR